MDTEYFNLLSEEEKSWMNDFLEEYYGANLDFKDLKKNRFHKTWEDKKACTDRNNARNRCQYGMAKAGGKINNTTNDDIIESVVFESSEDAMIALLDTKRKLTSENK
jgi:hypothetical protein